MNNQHQPNRSHDPQVRTLTEDSRDNKFYGENKKFGNDRTGDMDLRHSDGSFNQYNRGNNLEEVLQPNIQDEGYNRVVGDKVPEVYFTGQISIGENFFGDGGFCVELLLEVGDYWTLNSPPACVQTQTCYTKPGIPLIWYYICCLY